MRGPDIKIKQAINPLEPSDADALRQVIDRSQQLDQLIAAAADAGFDLREPAERNQMHRAIAESLMRSFFPTSHDPYDGSIDNT